MPSIAFITEPTPTRLDETENIVLEELRRRGIDAIYLPWDAPLSKLKEHDLLVAKTAYNYYRAIASFKEFLERVENTGLNMANSPEIISWNLEKTYLKELEAKGFSPAPTMWIKRESNIDLKTEMEKRRWEKVVLKPTISAGSFNTWVTTPKDVIDVEDDFKKANASQGYMMQQFLPEAVEGGEWSLVFFEGELSHTVRKKPKAGDFRVQKQYGGQYEKVKPTKQMVTLAEGLMETLPTTPLYGRVDGVEANGQFYLMEFELIEPDLYFGTCPEALPNYVDALGRAV